MANLAAASGLSASQAELVVAQADATAKPSMPFVAMEVPVDGAKPLVTVTDRQQRSEEHTSELQSPCNLVCRLLLEKKKNAAPVICAGEAFVVRRTGSVRNPAGRSGFKVRLLRSLECATGAFGVP